MFISWNIRFSRSYCYSISCVCSMWFVFAVVITIAFGLFPLQGNLWKESLDILKMAVSHSSHLDTPPPRPASSVWTAYDSSWSAGGHDDQKRPSREDSGLYLWPVYHPGDRTACHTRELNGAWEGKQSRVPCGHSGFISLEKTSSFTGTSTLVLQCLAYDPCRVAQNIYSPYCLLHISSFEGQRGLSHEFLSVHSLSLSWRDSSAHKTLRWSSVVCLLWEWLCVRVGQRGSHLIISVYFYFHSSVVLVNASWTCWRHVVTR